MEKSSRTEIGELERGEQEGDEVFRAYVGYLMTVELVNCWIVHVARNQEYIDWKHNLYR